MMNTNNQKVIVIGLDCGTPQIVFDWFANDLPNIAQLRAQGTWGNMRSTIPPITVPAWMSMMSSQSPGDLGVYGFRSRPRGGAYDAMDIANSTNIHVPLLWDYLGNAHKRVAMLGVPQTYPPRQVNGKMVTCFLTPGTDAEFTYPTQLKKEILDACMPNDYIFDFANRRQASTEEAFTMIERMTAQRQHIFESWMKKDDWDFLMMVEMGTDRIHHYFWHHIDPNHKDYVPQNPYRERIRAYYQNIDAFIGRIRSMAPKDTIIYIVSDHGAKSMKGMFVINEWLVNHGYLTLRTFPEKPKSIEACDIDWSTTKAWAWGGFYGRLFVNLKGREPQGYVDPSAYDALLEELRDQLVHVSGPQGESLAHRIVRGQELYPHALGDVPDLLIFWGDLSWKVAGTLGYHAEYIDHDDKGSDFGVHDWEGIFIRHDPRAQGNGRESNLDIYTVAPTILQDFGLSIPPEMCGTPLIVPRS